MDRGRISNPARNIQVHVGVKGARGRLFQNTYLSRAYRPTSCMIKLVWLTACGIKSISRVVEQSGWETNIIIQQPIYLDQKPYVERDTRDEMKKETQKKTKTQVKNKPLL